MGDMAIQDLEVLRPLLEAAAVQQVEQEQQWVENENGPVNPAMVTKEPSLYPDRSKDTSFDP